MSESKPLRMETNTLRERVARALVDHHQKEAKRFLSGEVDENTWNPLGTADAALAALGLDDLDAAVERAAVRIGGPRHAVERRYAASVARAALEAALTATEGGEGDD